MKRTYLEEDVRLVQKYFPGARTVTLRTPFDLTVRQPRTPDPALDYAGSRDYGWSGEMAWMR